MPGLTVAQRPLLGLGPEVDRSGAWAAGVAFAEKLGAPVYGTPLPDRISFPEDHALYQGQLPMTIAGVAEKLQGHDLAMRAAGVDMPLSRLRGR